MTPFDLIVWGAALGASIIIVTVCTAIAVAIFRGVVSK